MSDNKIMTAEEKFDEWYNNRLEGNTFMDFAKYYAEYYHEQKMKGKTEMCCFIQCHYNFRNNALSH